MPLAWYLTRAPGATGHGGALSSKVDEAALERLLQRADHALATGALVAPPEENAADLYREALARSTRDPRAVSGLEQVIDRLLADADAQLQAHHLEAAQQLADAARSISPSHPQVAFLSAQIGAQRERLILSKAQRAAASGDVSSALAVLDDAARGGAHRSTLVMKRASNCPETGRHVSRIPRPRPRCARRRRRTPAPGAERALLHRVGAGTGTE